MRKKSANTIVEQAVVFVLDFERVVRKLETQLSLPGQSKSTTNNRWVVPTAHSPMY